MSHKQHRIAVSNHYYMKIKEKKLKTVVSILFYFILQLPTSKSEDFSCPQKCLCDEVDRFWKVDCSQKGLTTFPRLGMSPRVRWLIMDSNNITTIPEHLGDSVPNLEKFSIAHNKISFLGEKSFGKMIFLKELILTGNMIQSIQLDVLLHNKRLKHLDFSHNRINSFPEDVLFHLTSWTVANLSYNLIKHLTRKYPQSSNAHPQNGGYSIEVTLDLSYNLLQDVAEDLVFPVWYPSILNISGNPRLSHSQTGNIKLLLRSLVNSPIRALHSRKMSLTRVPNVMFKTIDFPNLKELDLSNNKIVTVERGALDNLENLMEINLSDNQLTTMPNFTSIHKLEILDLSDNLFTRLDTSALPPSLKHLYLRRNYLKQITDRQFGHFINLESLSLNDNRLHSFYPQAFLKNLKVLELGGNQIRKENLPFVFKQCRSLMRLDLSRNRITSLHNNFTYGSPKLEFLNVSYNNFPQIQPVTLGARNIRVLDLSGNRIQILAEYGTPKLKELYMKHNTISTIDYTAFSEANQVEILDMSYNPVRARTLSLFREQVYRLANTLRILRLNHFEIFPYLRNDAWMFFRAFRILEEVQLSACDIKGTPGSSQSFPPSLKKLDLSHNKIRTIGKHSFQQMYTLLELDLSANNIHSISDESLINLKRLRTLHIAGNPLSCDCQKLRSFWLWTQETNTSIPGLYSKHIICSHPQQLKGKSINDIDLSSCTSSFTKVPLIIALLVAIIIVTAGATFYAILHKDKNRKKKILRASQTHQLIPQYRTHEDNYYTRSRTSPCRLSISKFSSTEGDVTTLPKTCIEV